MRQLDEKLCSLRQPQKLHQRWRRQQPRKTSISPAQQDSILQLHGVITVAKSGTVERNVGGYMGIRIQGRPTTTKVHSTKRQISLNLLNSYLQRIFKP